MWINEDNRETATWINYGFVTFACIAMCFFLANDKSQKRGTYTLTVPASGVVFFCLSLIFAIISLIYNFNYKIVLTGQGIISLSYIILLTLNITFNKTTASNMALREERINSQKEVLALAKHLRGQAVDTEAYRSLGKLVDTLSSLPLNSFYRYENTLNVSDRVEKIRQYIGEGDFKNANTACSSLVHELS